MNAGAFLFQNVIVSFYRWIYKHLRLYNQIRTIFVRRRKAMMYKSVYKAKNEPDRNYDIIYLIKEKNGAFYIEAHIEGSSVYETAALGSCGEKKAEELAHLLAEKAVRPVHIEDIISDMHF